MAKKYLLFAGCNYYPEGGVLDLRGEFDSIDQAKTWFFENAELIADSVRYIDNWGQIVDRKSMAIVLYGKLDELGGPMSGVWREPSDND